MGGLYELPHGGLPRHSAPMESLQDRYRGTLRVDPRIAFRLRHSVTHHRIEARVFKARLAGNRCPEGAAFHPIGKALELPLGGLTRKALRASGLLRP